MENNDPIANAIAPSTNHELIVGFLQRECGVTEAAFNDMTMRVAAWAESAPQKIVMNQFNPIMLIEQVRREFDEAADFVTFALVTADLQWGPRMMKVADFEKPVWIMTLEGFPKMIEQARAVIARGNDGK